MTVLFGMSVPSIGALATAEHALGARPAVVGTFADWANQPDFPQGFADEVNERGAVVLLSWEPWDSWIGEREQPEYTLTRIVSGDHDSLIDHWAEQLAAYGRPILLRFAAEMNGNWLPWSPGVNGNRSEDYIAAWRHVRDRFDRAGASSVQWVWNPIASYEGATPLVEVFPGECDVDWVAVDGYNWGSTRPWGWQSYADVLEPTLAQFGELVPERPMMIAEIGCAPGECKAEWVVDALNAARLGGVACVAWFEFKKETDWRLSGTVAASRAAGSALRDGGWLLGGDLAQVERAVSAAATCLGGRGSRRG